MNKIEYLNGLTEHAKNYREDAQKSIARNKHMNNVKGETVSQDVIDAVLVDFINYIGVKSWLDYGLYTSDFEKLKVPSFDINRKDLYEYDKPELFERTKNRLLEITELGMTECGNGEFGYKGVMSGLYIEKVWSYSDEDFTDYMDWVKVVISKKLNK